MTAPADETRDDRLFALQEALAEAIACGADIDPAQWARRFDVSEADVAACRRAAELLDAADPLGDADHHEATPPPLPDDYELLGELGRGGMGVVYRVRQRSLDREVALKLVRGDLLPDRARVTARFQREASSLARLRHPGIVSIHAVGRAGEHLYYTMDLVEGQDLAQRLHARPVSPSEAVHIVTQVADAVAHAHRQGVLHRDLKPANVLLDRDGRAFVVDFGIARELLDQPDQRTATGELLGTPAAMSPEQARGDQAAISERTDVHGLGLLLFWCLTAKPPFHATSLPQLLRRISDHDAPRADAVRRSVPSDLATICAKALAKQPDDRYPTAAAFADDLRRFAAGAPIDARRRGPGARLRTTLRRFAVPLASLATVLAITLGIVWSAVLPGAQRDDRLALARMLRDRGEVAAAATVLEELRARSDDPRITRAWTQSLLDRAEALRHAGDEDEQIGALLRSAGDTIADFYRVFRLGGGVARSARQAATSWERVRARAEDPSEADAERDAIAPWSVLQLRHATLTGDLGQVTTGLDQLAWTGGLDRALAWLATARQRPDHPAHLSAIGMLAVLVLPPESTSADDLAPAALAATRDRQAPQLAAHLDEVLRDPEQLRRGTLAPGESALVALATQLGHDPGPGPAPLAAHLLAHACGLPGDLPAAPAARAELIADLRHYVADRSAPPTERLRRRLDLLLRHWPADADAATTSAWRRAFIDATGAPADNRDAARVWWQEHREAPPQTWLARALGLDPQSLDVATALSRLGAAVTDGIALRRAHDLLSIVVADSAVALRSAAPLWNAGGVASQPGRATAPRRALVLDWTEALRDDATARYRLRLAVALFEDAAAVPRIVARHQVEFGLGDTVEVDAEHRGVLPYDWITPTVERAGGDVWGRSTHHDSSVRLRLQGHVLPGALGATLRARDESTLQLAAHGGAHRSSHGEVHVEPGVVAALSHLSGELPFSGWHQVEALVLATLEPVSASPAPWPAERWRTALEQGILDQTAAGAPRLLDDAVLEAASYLPAPAARAALRAQIPLREAAERRPLSFALARALLLAGDTDPALDDHADLYEDWSRTRGLQTLAFWARLAAIATTDPQLRQRALRRFLPPEDSGIEPADLGLGLAQTMRRVLATADGAGQSPTVPDRLREMLDDAPRAQLGWWLRRAAAALLGPLTFALWLLALALLWLPSRPGAIRDEFTMRCVVLFYWTGFAAIHPMLVGGRWLLLVDWQMLAIACAAALLAARRQEHRPRSWRRLMIGMVALTALLCIARASGHAAWVDQHIVAVRMVGAGLVLLGVIGLDTTTRRRRRPRVAAAAA